VPLLEDDSCNSHLRDAAQWLGLDLGAESLSYSELCTQMDVELPLEPMKGKAVECPFGLAAEVERSIGSLLVEQAEGSWSSQQFDICTEAETLPTLQPFAMGIEEGPHG
jgi:hypothetical protein